MDKFWSIPEEKQRLINSLHLEDPGSEDYEAALKALSSLDNICPEEKFNWKRMLEKGLPVWIAIAIVAGLEAGGLIFTGKGFGLISKLFIK